MNDIKMTINQLTTDKWRAVITIRDEHLCTVDESNPVDAIRSAIDLMTQLLLTTSVQAVKNTKPRRGLFERDAAS